MEHFARLSAWTCRLFERQGRPLDCSASSSDPMMERPGADSGEKRDAVGDIDIAVVDSLKVQCLTPDGRLEKRTSFRPSQKSALCQQLPLDVYVRPADFGALPY